MIALLPVGVAGPAGAPDTTLPYRTTPVVWWLFGVIALFAALDLLAGLRGVLGWTLLPEAVARIWFSSQAHLAIYQDPELFAPWQLWTAALLNDGWFGRPGAWFFTAWQVTANLGVLLVAGRALERALGSATFFAVVLLLAPLAGAVHLRSPAQLVLGTASALVCALAALAWAFFYAHRLRATLAYWMVVSVGVVPFHLHLRWLALSFAVLEIARLFLSRVDGVQERSIGMLAALLVGFVLGALVRQLARSR